MALGWVGRYTACYSGLLAPAPAGLQHDKLQVVQEAREWSTCCSSALFVMLFGVVAHPSCTGVALLHQAAQTIESSCQGRSDCSHLARPLRSNIEVTARRASRKATCLLPLQAPCFFLGVAGCCELAYTVTFQSLIPDKAASVVPGFSFRCC